MRQVFLALLVLFMTTQCGSAPVDSFIEVYKPEPELLSKLAENGCDTLVDFRDSHLDLYTKLDNTKFLLHESTFYALVYSKGKCVQAIRLNCKPYGPKSPRAFCQYEDRIPNVRDFSLVKGICSTCPDPEYVVSSFSCLNENGEYTSFHRNMDLVYMPERVFFADSEFITALGLCEKRK
jgi:hypothetical protein